MRFVVRTLALAAVMLAASALALGQDLGSANKLFGGSKAPAAKKAAPMKRPAPARASTRRTATTAKKKAGLPSPHSTASADRTTAKAAPSKPHEVTAPTGKKITKPGDKAADKSSAEKRSASAADASAAPPNAAPHLTGADQARFEDLIDRANAARDDRDYTRAESIYKNARSIKPRDALAIYGLGNVYSDLQRWEEAENSYRTALQLEPSNAMTHVALSYVLTQPLAVDDLSDRYAEAEKLAMRGTELSPASALAFDQLGVAMEMRGQIGRETENAYRKAIALDPSFAPAYAHLGRLLRRRGQADKAEEAYAQARERSADVGTMVIVAGVLQSEQHFAESVPLLKEALAADPRNPSALLMMGRALTVTGEYKDAESMLQRALSFGQDAYMANGLLASLYSRQGAYELAEKALLRAINTAPPYEHRQLARGFITVAQGYIKAGKSQQAQRAFAKAAELDPESGPVSGRFRPQR